MLCYIESTKGDAEAIRSGLLTFLPPQSERESIEQVIKITELIKAINRLNMVPDEDRVSRWMRSGLSLEEATIRVDIKDYASSMEVKNTAFISSWREIPDSRFTIERPSRGSSLGVDTISATSTLSVVELLQARARLLAKRLLDGRILAGPYHPDNEVVITLPKDEGHRVGLKQLAMIVRVKASQLDEVLCELRDFEYQGTFASRKQSLTLAKFVTQAAEQANVDGVVRSYDVRSVDIQFPDRVASIAFVKKLDEVSNGSLKTMPLTRCVIRVASYTAAEAVKLLNKTEESK
jgi:hypothetical protein